MKRLLSRSLVVLGGASLVYAVVVHGLIDPSPFTRANNLRWLLTITAPWCVGGIVTYLKRPDQPAARRLLIIGTYLPLNSVLTGIVIKANLRGEIDSTWFPTAVLLAGIVVATVAFFELLVLFPTGYVSRLRRIVVGVRTAALSVAPLLILSNATLLAPVPNGPLPVANPLAVPALASLAPIARGLFDSLFLLDVMGLVVMLVRYRRLGREDRRRMKWLAVPVLILVGSSAGTSLGRWLGIDAGDAVTAVVNSLALMLVPVAFSVALLRPHLFDIDSVLRRTVVYGVAWLVIGFAYVGAAAGIGMVAAERYSVAIAVGITIVATLAFRPLRAALDRVASRRILGERFTGQAFVARFGEMLQHAFDAGELAPRVATSVRDGLGLEWARVALVFDGETVVRVDAGDPGTTEPELIVPLMHAGVPFGTIECGPKLIGRIEAADREALETLARQAALAFHNARLAAELASRLEEIRRQAGELAASRARIVAAQDAERRRIERDIHDGVQQRIVALGATLRLARNQLRRDAAVADRTLEQLQDEALRTLAELRELTRGIYPPVLIDRGLLEAIEARASALPIGVAIDAHPEMRGRRFSEDVEIAAYFVVSEALTNVIKHAGVTEATVSLRADDEALIVEIADEGAGFARDPGADGSGLVGLRDRVEASGGKLIVSSGPGRGTRVVATFPVPQPASELSNA